MNKHLLFIIGWIVTAVGVSYAQPNGYVSHYEWWGRSALNKTIHAKFKMEAEYQHRRQNLHTDNYNALAGTSMNSVRLWGYYQPIKNLQVNFSPFAFFATQTLAGRQNFTSGLEYRWGYRAKLPRHLIVLTSVTA